GHAGAGRPSAASSLSVKRHWLCSARICDRRTFWLAGKPSLPRILRHWNGSLLARRLTPFVVQAMAQRGLPRLCPVLYVRRLEGLSAAQSNRGDVGPQDGKTCRARERTLSGWRVAVR